MSDVNGQIDIYVDISETECGFCVFSSVARMELTFGSLSILMTEDQFSIFCENIKPWIVEARQ